jgi:hypothetical protein
MEKYGFVYLWFDRYRKMYYIGCHWGLENDGYLCSSHRMRDAHRRRPQDFKRRIIDRTDDREELFELEYKWLKFIKHEEKGNKYYNLKNTKWEHWSTNVDKAKTITEKIITPESNAKRSAAHMGKILSEETKEKLRQINLGKTINVETRAKISESLKIVYSEGKRKTPKGNKVSEETKMKTSNTLKLSYSEGRRNPVQNFGEKNGFSGKKHSDETRAKMSLAAKNRKR